MSRWTHNTCIDCWNAKYPNRQPVRLKHQEGETLVVEKCCYCVELTTDGIYTREDPNKLLCKGNHPGDD